MKWASALSERPSLSDAVRECSDSVRGAFGGSPPDLAVLFVSQEHAAAYDEAPAALDEALRPRRLLGCSAGGVLAAGREVEQRRAVSLVAAALPEVELRPFHLDMDALPSGDAAPGAWAQAVGLTDRTTPAHFILLADPFTFNPEDLTRGLDYAFPRAVKVGGLASGGSAPGENALFLGGESRRSGAVGLTLSGNVQIDPIVAQGCRPVGRPLQITACERNVLLALDGAPALRALEELFESLPPEDQRLARTSLFLGVLNDSLRGGASKRDFLIRNLVGLDPEAGALAVGAMLRPGQTVQFHLRDKRASAQDLDLMLRRYAEAKPEPAPAGALLFSCLGRGRYLYGAPDHDSEAFRKTVGPLPLGGFFCNGEIGPVEGATYLHGYTSCFGIFRPLR